MSACDYLPIGPSLDLMGAAYLLEGCQTHIKHTRNGLFGKVKVLLKHSGGDGIRAMRQGRLRTAVRRRARFHSSHTTAHRTVPTPQFRWVMKSSPAQGAEPFNAKTMGEGFGSSGKFRRFGLGVCGGEIEIREFWRPFEG